MFECVLRATHTARDVASSCGEITCKVNVNLRFAAAFHPAMRFHQRRDTAAAFAAVGDFIRRGSTTGDLRRSWIHPTFQEISLSPGRNSQSALRVPDIPELPRAMPSAAEKPSWQLFFFSSRRAELLFSRPFLTPTPANKPSDWATFSLMSR